MPSHHGYIIWAFRAFKNEGKIGHFFGFYNAIGSTLAMAKDIPLYVTVMLFYFEQFFKAYFNDFSMTFIQKYISKLVIIMIGGIFDLANITTLGNSNMCLMIIVFLPFIIGFIYTLPETSIAAIASTKPYNETHEYQLGLWLSTLIWLHTGWDSVAFKKSKLFLAFLVAIVLDYVSYTMPILGSLTQKCEGVVVCTSVDE